MSAAAAFDDDADTAIGVWAIVVAAGAGSRFGGAKQYALLGGKRVLDWSLATARASCAEVILVVPPDRADAPEAADHVVAVARPVPSRCGPGSPRSRPTRATTRSSWCTTPPVRSPRRALFEAVIAAVRSGADGAVPGLPITDTVKQVRADRSVVATLDRAHLVAVQTPQAFRLPALRAAHHDGGEATDDAALVEAVGGRVVVVEGEVTNRKITTPPTSRESGHDACGSVRASTCTRSTTSANRPLVLGGVVFPRRRRFGAQRRRRRRPRRDRRPARRGRPRRHRQALPRHRSRWKDADSIGLLAQAVTMVRAAGWQPGNVDCTVIAEAPKLAPRRAEIEDRLSSTVGAPVTVKAKRAEGLGALGRREGIACFAVAIVTNGAP